MEPARYNRAWNYGRVVYTKVKAQIHRASLRKIYAEVQDYTMVAEGVFCDNLQLAEGVHNIPGCVVECGVWRGGMSAGLACILGDNREYYLFDSFVGLPQAREIDGANAIAYQQDTSSPVYYDNCAASAEFAQKAMNMVGAKRFHLMPGFFNKTLPEFHLEEDIALLRLDGDWYDLDLCLPEISLS